ncbi:MAG: outer membrane protein assembly factor [Bacteroidia bacterium]|nr:outer membrane protein assembly factor [Bacteroidia bacterium]
MINVLQVSLLKDDIIPTRTFVSVLLVAGHTIFSVHLCGQDVSDSLGLARPEAYPEPPFFIHPLKRLSDQELREKREGTFVTGLPRWEYDPIRGFGIGAEGFLYVNKTRKDPFFAYTPYRYRIDMNVFIFQNTRYHLVGNFDAPFLGDAPYRMRANIEIIRDPDAQYWGIGRKHLFQALIAPARSSGEVPRTFQRVNAYEEALSEAFLGSDGRYYTDENYTRMLLESQLYNVGFERLLAGGRLRLFVGYEVDLTRFRSHAGRRFKVAGPDGEVVEAIQRRTRLDEEVADGTWTQLSLTGYEESRRWWVSSILAWAVMYDTRDLEPDPTHGVFLEYSHELQAPWLGGDFRQNKFMVQTVGFYTPLRWGRWGRLTLAGLAAFGYIWGSRINFIELYDISSQAEAGGILVLGGARSVRGFRESRFVAPAVAQVNLELRTHLYGFRLLRQDWIIGTVTFYDMGSIWDNLRQIKSSTQGWIGAPGAGLRLAWNQSTILRWDIARSREGTQTFFAFQHIF